MTRLIASIILILVGALLTACGRSPQLPPAPPVTVSSQPAIPATLEEAAAAKQEGKFELYELALRRLAKSPDLATSRRATTILGLFFEEQRRDTEALALFKSLAEQDSKLRPYQRLHLLRAQQRLGHFEEAATTAEAILTEAPESYAASLARIRLPAIDARLGNSERMRSSLAALEKVEVDEFTEAELIETAESLDQTGETSAASALRYRLLSRYPQGRHIESIYGKLIADPDSPLMLLDFREALDLADRLGRVNRYDQALDSLSRIEKKFSNASRNPAYRYLRQRSLFNSRNYADARAIRFEPGEQFYVASEILRARAHWRDQENEPFRSILENIIARHPKSREASESHVLLGKYHLVDEGDPKTASEHLRRALDAGSFGAEGENLWTLGWTYTMAGDDERALATLQEYLTRYPDSDYTSNALFWSGKIEARRGNVAARDEWLRRLIAKYPYSYYSYRAREITGMPPDSKVEIESAQPFPTIDLSVDDPAVALVDDLLETGMKREAASELKRFTGANNLDRSIAFRLADLYAEAGENFKAMAILQKHFRDVIRHGATDVPQRFWEILYPRNYWGEIQAAASLSGLDPYFISSIIRQESGFEPTIVSNAGAVGLMQLMPNELERIATRAGMPGATRDALFDPGVNVRLGATELSMKLEIMKGNPILAIAAYNAGEDAVSRWIAQYPADDVDRFIDSIPFNETRLYVKTVLRNHAEYNRIYGSSPMHPGATASSPQVE